MQLGHAVSIDNVGSDVGLTNSFDYCITLAACARGDNYFRENFGVLSTLVSYNGTNTAGSDDYDFCHFLVKKLECIKKW